MKTSGENHIKVYIITYLICVIQVNGASLTITQYPQYPTVSTTAILTCHIPSFTGGAEWIRNGTRLTTVCFSDGCFPPSIPGYQFSADPTTINVTISSLNITFDETTWTCIHNAGVDIGYFNLTVYIPVGSVQVKNGTNLSLIESLSAVLVCETDACRPSAAIYWMKNGINITDSPTYLTVVGVSSGQFVSIGTLNYTGQRVDDGALLTCAAYNGLGSVKTSASLTIYYPPTVNSFISPIKVIQGQTLEVVCSADGNPSPQVSWNPAGEDKVNKSRLYYPAISRDKTGVHTCTATNNMVPTTGSPKPGSGSRELLIDVLYSPILKNFASPVKVIQGQQLEVVCIADGNPSPQMSWNPAGEDRVNNSRLYYSAISRDKTGVHTCTATNNMVPTTGSPQAGSDSREFVMDVLYPPTVNNFASPVKVIQGQPLEVVCSADGNPPPQISWNPAGEDRVNKSRLYYSALSMDKAVVHTCTATNNMMRTNESPQNVSRSKELLIDILCISSVPTNVIVAVNGPNSVTLEWMPGIDHGYPHEFVIQYRIYPDGTWVTLNPIKETRSTKQSITIKDLQQKTTYEFQLYAENLKEPGNNLSVIVTTTAETKDNAFPVGVVAGSISGTLVAIICADLIIILLWLRGQKNKRRGETYESVNAVGRSSNKENAYDSLSHDKIESSGDIAYENTGAAISHSPVDRGSMELTNINN